MSSELLILGNRGLIELELSEFSVCADGDDIWTGPISSRADYWSACCPAINQRSFHRRILLAILPNLLRQLL